MLRFDNLPRPRLTRADSGATAIEYAILASLVGLGIVGSLVTTRTSLSSVFGTASSQMASSTSASATAPSGGTSAPSGAPSGSERAAYFQAKVLNTSSRSADTTSFRYNDGSFGTIVKTGQAVQYDFFDVANLTWSRSYFDGSGKQYNAFYATYGDKDRNCPCTTTVSNDFSNGVMQTADYKAWNASAQPIASQSGITPSASFLSENQRIAVDIQYHLGLFGY